MRFQPAVRLRRTLAVVAAASIGLVPVAWVATPAQAAAGDVTIDSDLESVEGDTFTFEIRREGPTAQPLTLKFDTVAGTAPDASITDDLIPITGTTTFAASSRDVVKRFSIQTTDDALNEDPENFVLEFRDNVNSNLITSAFGIIDDNDNKPSYTLAVTNPVGESATAATVTATISPVSGRSVSIPWTTSPGTATATDDYDPAGGTITIPAGSTTGTATVPIEDDLLDEANEETFDVVGGDSANATKGSPSSVTVRIADDDLPPEVSITAPANVTEGSTLTFPVTLDAPSGRTVTVRATTSDGSAKAGSDYTTYNQVLTFTAGDQSEDVVVTTATDSLDEVDPEAFTVTLTELTNTTAGTRTSVQGSIDDDDDAPVATLSPSTVSEGTSGTVAKEFAVTLDAASGREVRVDYTVSGGTAVAGDDFQAVPAGTLVFAPGDTVETITVPVIGDRIDEGAGEDFVINLSNSGGTIGGASDVGDNTVTITDDDATPTLSQLTSIPRAEGDTSSTANFVIELSNPSAEAITLQVDTTDVTTDSSGGTAPGDSDYDPITAMMITIPAGDESKTIPVTINGDEVYEDDETATLDVTIPNTETDVTGADASATLTLENDDDAPTVELSQSTAAEGGSITVTGTVTGEAQDGIPVTVTLTGAGPDPAEGSDFSPTTLTDSVSAGTVTFGQVALADDTVDENNESVLATLTDASHLIATTSKMQTITDDPNDLPPSFSIADQTYDENDGTVDVEVVRTYDPQVTDAQSTERTMSVRYATSDGTAREPGDYDAKTGTLTFAPADPDTGNIGVALTDDGIFERDETFTVTLSDPSPADAVITDAAGTMTITDDDSGSKPTFAVSAPSGTVTEGTTTTANVTITMSPGTTQDVDFAITADDGTATRGQAGPGGDDYAVPTTARVLAGQPSVTVPVTIKNDPAYEGTETATVKVNLAQGEDDAVAAEKTATLTITDDETRPTVALTAQSGTEGDTVTVTGTVTGIAQRAIPVTVTAAGALNGAGTHAAEAADLDTTGLSVAEIPGGDQTGAPVPLGTFVLANDQVDEYPETVEVSLAGTGLGTSPVTTYLTIADAANDMTPTITIGDAPVSETGPRAQLPVTLDFGQGNDATSTTKTLGAHWATADGTAKAASDYTAANGDVTFTGGTAASTENVEVTITDDNLYELQEAFAVNLSAPVGTTIGRSGATVTITDNDGSNKPTFAVTGPPTFREGTAGTLDYTVTLTPENTQDVDFVVTLDGGTATQDNTRAGGDDFATPTGTLKILAGARTGIVHVTVKDDAVFEATESATLKVALAGGEDDAGGPMQQTPFTITDDDPAPTVALVAESGGEGTDLLATAEVTGVAQADMVYSLTLTGDSTGGNNAAEPSDYANSGETATVPGGTPSGTRLTFRTFRLNNDTIDEPVEAIRVVATNTTTTVSSEPQIFKINDDPNDVPPSVSVGDVTVAEGAGTAAVPVTLAFPSSTDTTETEQTVVVNLATGDDTAYEPSDYAARASSVSFSPGTTSGTFDVAVVNDVRNEDDETFTVAVTSATPAGTPIARSTGTVTVTDNDQNVVRPSYTVANVSQPEGSAASLVPFTVRLTQAAADDVTFTISVADDSAVDAGSGAGSNDYNPPAAQTLTIGQGDLTGIVRVPVNGDAVYEDDEDMTLTVALATGERDATGGPVDATLTLENDDARPTVVLSNGSGTEGDDIALAGTVVGSTEEAVTVDVAFSGDTTSGANAAETADFDTAGVNAVVPARAVTGTPISIGSLTLVDDTIDEPIETVKAVSGTRTTTYRIFDDPDDVPPAVAVGDSTVGEAAGPAQVPVTLVFPPASGTTETEQTVVVNLATGDGTATDPADYAAKVDTLTFTPGTTSGNFGVTLVNDLRNEDDETFTVSATSATPTGTTIMTGTGTVTILDNDQNVARPSFSVADVSRPEGNAAGTAAFTVQLSRAAADDVTFAVGTADDTAVDTGTGVGGNDYNAPTATTLTIEAGGTTGTVQVPVNGDAVFEDDETATVTVALATGERDATGGPVDATLTLENDDARPTVALSNGSGSEGDDIALAGTVVGSTQDATTAVVTFSGDGSGTLNAAEDEDFGTDGIDAAVPAGAVTGTPINIGSLTLNDDTIDELTETIKAVSGTRTTTYRIFDDVDDLPPTVSVTDATIGEYEGSVDVDVVLTFPGDTTAAGYDITVPWQTTMSGEARPGLDFTGRSASTTIAEGNDSSTVNVPITDDDLYEGDQAFGIELGTPSPGAVKVDDGSGEVTILEDDEVPTPGLTAPAGRVGQGTISMTGTAGEGARVVLWAAPLSAPANFTAVQTVYADLEGQYTISRTVTVGTNFYTVSNGERSATRTVRLTQAPTVTGGSTAKGVISLTVNANPKAAGQTVQVQQVVNGAWKTISTGKTTSAGTYAVTVRNLRSGTYASFRAVLPATPGLGILGSTSPAVRYGVR